MRRIPPKTALRIHKALIISVCAFIFLSLSYKLGSRGKYEAWDTSSGWAELIQTLPSISLVALLIGLLYFVWPRN
jgi:ABC-type proline/glycine betaine transport system permease subunit